MDVVLDGLLLKSPPVKRFCKGVRKWRERWFVLRHSGQIPGQFVLEYYTDSTCRKLKGKIDLDQCEQVDSGLPYENRKTPHQHMFNIHTPKRIYYLVAKSELEMNKWVDCICSVCGLKIRVEDEVGQTTVDQNSVPITSAPSVLATPSQSISNLLTTNCESSPYIPISECITGKPLNGFSTPERRKNHSPQPPPHPQPVAPPPAPPPPPINQTLDILSQVPPPPPPKTVQQQPETSFVVMGGGGGTNDEFYDHPKPIFSTPHNNNNGRTSPEPNMEDMYKIPPVLIRPVVERQDWDGVFTDDDSSPLCPPKVNWKTYPLENGPANSTYDHPVNSTYDVPVNSTYDVPVNSTYDVPVNSTYDVPVNQGVAVGGIRYVTMQEKVKLMSGKGKLSTNASDFQDTELSSALLSAEEKAAANEGTTLAPPRPPKPANLGDKKKAEIDSIVETSSSNLIAANNAILYDIPPSSKGVFLSKQIPAEAFAFLKDDTSPLVDLSPSTKVPVAGFKQVQTGSGSLGDSPTTTAVGADEMYDFPRFRSDNHLGGGGKKMPSSQANHSSLRRPRHHAYTNAPPGLFSGKNNVMNYEYRPSLMNKDHPINMDGGGSMEDPILFETNSPPPLYSPVMAADATYTNVGGGGGSMDDLSHVPPLINRGLKPKKKHSDTTEPGFGPFNLAPPPALQPGHSKCSFRKQRAAPSPIPSGSGLNSVIPSIPYRTAGHQTDQSSSDDDSSSFAGSRRNSNNDDQVKHFLSPPAPYKIKAEIQYLDLDLDSDGTTSQSPRSPDQRSSSSSSTVYKTVDFVKTNALNVVKQNVNETYRKNQST